MSIFISTTYLGDGSDILRAIDELHRVGVKKVEFGSNHAYCSEKRIRELIQSDKGSNYIAHNYFLGKDPHFVLNIASEEDAVINKSINFIKHTVEVCQKLKIPFYTIHPGFLADVATTNNKAKSKNFDFIFRKKNKKDRERILKKTIYVIKELVKDAKKKNVQLLVENEGSQTSREFVIFDSIGELDMLKREVGKNLKFNFNLAHATLAGINLNNYEIFSHFYKDSPFFEVSEIDKIYDSHLPIFRTSGTISSLIKKYKNQFSEKNIILEYRNINIKDVTRSYSEVKKLLDPFAPVA